MKKLALYLAPLTIVLALVGVASFALTARAATAVASLAQGSGSAVLTVATTTTTAVTGPAAPDPSLLDLVTPVYNAFSGGHFAYAAALLVILLVALAKRYGVPKWAFLGSDAGGALLALLAAFGTALAAALAAPGAVISLALLKSSLLIGIGAAGGYTMLKDLIVDPILKPLAASAPAWAQPILALVLWVFDKGQTGDPEAAATAAGTAAVAAKPATGIDGVIGTSTEVK